MESQKTKRRCNTMTAKYEILYIIRPDMGDDQKQALVERFDGI